jgi:hypothetical protein
MPMKARGAQLWADRPPGGAGTPSLGNSPVE